jgi:hypothetical protein
VAEAEARRGWYPAGRLYTSRGYVLAALKSGPSGLGATAQLLDRSGTTRLDRKSSTRGSRKHMDNEKMQGEGSAMFNWIREWWITWQVWRNAVAEQRAILTAPFDSSNFVEVERP